MYTVDRSIPLARRRGPLSYGLVWAEAAGRVQGPTAVSAGGQPSEGKVFFLGGRGMGTSEADGTRWEKQGVANSVGLVALFSFGQI